LYNNINKHIFCDLILAPCNRFPEVLTRTADSEPISVKVADVDGSSMPDIVVANYGANYMIVLS